jgi:hypothetical protein
VGWPYRHGLGDVIETRNFDMSIPRWFAIGGAPLRGVNQHVLGFLDWRDFDDSNIFDACAVARIDPYAAYHDRTGRRAGRAANFGSNAEQPNQGVPDQPAKIAHRWNYQPIRGRQS